jgi:hypothetical protein
MLFSSDRQFRLWDYNISHRQLLLRSTKSESHVDNIDIVFWSVAWISLPTSVEGIEIHVSKDPVLSMPHNAEGVLYRFVSGANVHHILAHGCRVMSNILDSFDSSLVYAHIDRPDSEYGVILAKG